MSSGHSSLAALLPNDLDALNSPPIIGALGVQLLLFGGFEPNATGGWSRQRVQPPASLAERVDLIAPTWKFAPTRGARGRVDYTWPEDNGTGPQADGADISLFAAASKLAVPDATTKSLARVLEENIGLRASDFDDTARAALVKMLTWRVPHESRAKNLVFLHETGA